MDKKIPKEFFYFYMEIKKLFREIIEKRAMGMHLTVNMPPMLNIEGRLFPTTLAVIDQNNAVVIADQLMNEKSKAIFAQYKSVHFTYDAPGSGRFRINIFQQRNLLSIVIRVILDKIPTLSELNLPKGIEKIAGLRRGLCIFTGPSGCGKTTTLAAIVNIINQQKNAHIITMEDPIEYIHTSNKCIISQREIGKDSKSFSIALKEALRQDPDVILIGEMQDRETISIALTAAETGHLVLATMHTIDAVQSIDRIIDAFSSAQQHQIKIQLSIALEAVVSQQLVFRADGKGRIPANEIMFVLPSIRNLIRESKTHQIYSILETSGEYGMQSFDQCLHNFQRANIITNAEALAQATSPYRLIKKIAATDTPFIPKDSSEVKFYDSGAETLHLDRQTLLYKADFTPGYEEYWTTSGNIKFDEDGLSCKKNPLNPSGRLYVSDFNIVGNRKKSFKLKHHVLLKYRLEIDLNIQPPAGREIIMQFKLFFFPEKSKPVTYDKALFKLPLNTDGAWHSMIIDLPVTYRDKLVKIYMFEFSNLLKSFSINDILFF
ncbi:MAG: PilT/PilU family type 4a pilus ATPase [Candidatus Omnitrophota bacterium]